MADQIVRIALEHGVTVREDADLVEILSKLDIDALIPLEAFTAVAEILSYIYRTQGGRTPGSRPAGDPPAPVFRLRQCSGLTPLATAHQSAPSPDMSDMD